MDTSQVINKQHNKDRRTCQKLSIQFTQSSLDFLGLKDPRKRQQRERLKTIGLI